MKQAICCISLILTVLNGHSAEKPHFKFGNVDASLIKMTECSFYPEADAMVLGEIGDLKFTYDNDKGFQYVLETTVRKKIFTAEGKDQANVKFRLYQPKEGGNQEMIANLKAFTYNLSGSKVEKSKLSNSDIFETRANDYYVEYSFALPDVKEGSVIEYRYELVSDYYTNLSSWYFQGSIPVEYSSFQFEIPEYFNYQSSVLGNLHPLEEKVENSTQSFTITQRNLVTGTSQVGGPGAPVGRSEVNEFTVTPKSIKSKYTARNVLPVENEPYMNNENDVPCRIEFQLVSTHFPSEGYKPLATTYETFTAKLMERDDFGMRIRNAPYAKDWIASVASMGELEKAMRLYQKTENNFVWDGYFGMTSRKAGRMAFNNKEGEVADINLTLVAILKAAGLNAYPVILSTRGHGHVHPVYPSWQDFNYVIAAVIIDEEIYLADATTELPFGQLPTRCFNGMGWLADANGGWVDLKANSDYKTAMMFNIKIDADRIRSECNAKAEAYAALYEIDEFEEKGEVEYGQIIKDNVEDWEVVDLTFNEDNDETSFKYSMVMEQPIDDPSLIYLQPFGDGVFVENPFAREDRMSPIDFTYHYSMKVVAILEVPEGYEIEPLEQVRISMPDKGMTFKYQIVNQGTSITIISDLKITNGDYQPSNYTALKDFFQEMVDKNNQVVVLKKI